MSHAFAADPGWVACPDHRVDFDPDSLQRRDSDAS